MRKHKPLFFLNTLHRYALGVFIIISCFFALTDVYAEGEIPIMLRVEIPDIGILNTSINMPESCDVIDTTTSTPTHFDGYKAICVLQAAQEQNLLTYQTTNWGFGFALDAVNGNTNTTDWSESWIVRLNNATTMTGIDSVLMKPNDELLLTFGTWPMEPLQTLLSTTTLAVGVTTTVNTEVWNDTTNAFEPFISTTTILSGNQENLTMYESGTGIFEWMPTVTGTFYVRTEAAHKTRSKSIMVTITEALTSTQTDTTTNTTSSTISSDTSNNNSNNGTGGGIIPEDVQIPAEQINNSINKILDYLKSQQDATGKILDGGTSDWAIMSFGARGIYAEDIHASSTSLLDFAKAYQFTDPSDINLCASYPRHALALLAAGIPVTDALIASSTEKITSAECNQENGYGYSGINDDLFALLLLLELGNTTTHPVVSTTLNAILKDQTTDGAFTWVGFAAPDITGAVLNAVKFAQHKGVVIDDTIINNAKNYLHAQQLADGGWGFGTSDALTTSWALMGVNALGEGQLEWTNAHGKNPWHILTGQLKDSGYYEPSWAPGIVDWFGTKHAVPALAGKSWPIVLTSKPTPSPSQSNNSPSGSGFILIENTTTTITPQASFIIPPITSSTTSTLTLIISTPPTNTISAEKFVGIEESIKNNKKIKDIKQNTNNTKQVITESISLPNVTLTGELFVASTSTIPFQNTARGVFATAATLTTTLGAYLIWRFVQTLV